jgi:hypothetical protein
VPDRLLEEPWLRIEAASGTPVGAMIAALWSSVSKAAMFSPLQRSPIDILLGRWTLDHSPAYVALDLIMGASSRHMTSALHRGAVPGAVLSTVPAGRAVRQAHGGQWIGHGNRGLDDGASRRGSQFAFRQTLHRSTARATRTLVPPLLNNSTGGRDG